MSTRAGRQRVDKQHFSFTIHGLDLNGRSILTSKIIGVVGGDFCAFFWVCVLRLAVVL